MDEPGAIIWPSNYRAVLLEEGTQDAVGEDGQVRTGAGKTVPASKPQMRAPGEHPPPASGPQT